MIQAATLGALGLLMLALFLAIFRLIRGPSLPDRVVALDLIGVISLGIVLVLTVRTEEPVYLDVAIVMGVVSFMGTVAFARYLERVAER